MTIIEAVCDKNLFRPFLGDDLTTWKNWLAALRAVYGLPVKTKAKRETVRVCTGRDASKLPKRGFDTTLFLTGRRSGKSRIAAVIGAYEAVLAGHEKELAKGERGVVAVVAPSKRQGRIVRDYLRALFDTPILAQEVIAETKEGFELRNGTLIEIMAGDFRTVRGFTLLAAIVDEAAFFGLDEESKVKSDTELVAAIRPGLATVGGKLIAITSPYAKRGWCYQQFTKHHGNDASAGVLIWNCPSRTMNPRLKESVVKDALAEDLAKAKSEYLGEFRDDIAAFLPRGVIERVVIEGRSELLPQQRTLYAAFADVSGGRVDDAAIAIGHTTGRVVVVDCIKRYRPPFNPHEVVGSMAELVKRFGIRRVIGDNYAAEFVARAFESCGLIYEKSDKPKSALYAELLPRLCSGEIELPDEEALVDQLASLERRTRSGGKDVIDHPAGGHDDLANVVAGVADCLSARLVKVGGIGCLN
jgi:hypothetical protein